MKIIKLSGPARSSLEQIVRKTNNAKLLQCAHALPPLDDYEPVTKVAARAGVSHQTVYAWARRLHEREGEPVAQRLLERPRSGRPPSKPEVATAFIDRADGNRPPEIWLSRYGLD